MHASVHDPHMTTLMTDTGPRLPRSFTPLAASNLAAQSAEQLSQAAVPMVAVLALGAGPGEIGLLAAAQSLPFLLFALPFGVWADRGSRRRLMLGAEALRGLSLLLALAGFGVQFAIILASPVSALRSLPASHA